MKDSEHLGALVQMDLPRDSTLRPTGTIQNTLQILGFLKTCP